MVGGDSGKMVGSAKGKVITPFFYQSADGLGSYKAAALAAFANAEVHALCFLFLQTICSTH